MSFIRSVFIASMGAALCISTAASAYVIADSATLPVLGSAYGSTIGAGCFPALSVCVAPGTITLTSLVSSTFGLLGQDIVTTAEYRGTLTDIGGGFLQPISLSGNIRQRVLGRTFSEQVGSWNVELLELSLSGPVLGNTLTMSLSPLNDSGGITSISTDDEESFRIDSFFDVFIELNLDSQPPLSTIRGPISLTLAPAAVAEPATLALVGFAAAGLAAVRRRRA